MSTTTTRKRLIEALKAIAKARPRIDFRTAFVFLRRYVPGTGPRRDKELDRAFRQANDALGNPAGDRNEPD